MIRGINPWRVVVKAISLFVVLNVVYALVDPPITISGYNLFFPGRVRMPFDGAEDNYSVMVDDLDIMLASHAISRQKEAGEFRVVLIGDSSVWSEGIPAQGMFSEIWDARGNRCGDKTMLFYNLGYPHPSVIKDLVILREAKKYDPDLIIWFLTENTIMPRRVNPFITANREKTIEILDAYHFSISGEDELRLSEPAFYERTLIGKRSLLARWIKLQILGLVWSATGADYHEGIRESASLPANDVPADLAYFGLEPQSALTEKFMFDAIHAGHDLAGATPVLIVNEPIFLASGMNSDLRYNDFFPRWAYDQYRDEISKEADRSGWNYFDEWNSIPQKYFLTPLHLSAEGEQIFVENINPKLMETVCH